MKKLIKQHASITKTSQRPCLACSPSRSQAVNATFGLVTSSRGFALWAALALVLAGLGGVEADTISYGLIDEGGNYAVVIGWVPQFDPAMGQLTDVSIEFIGHMLCDYFVVNNTPLDTPFTYSVSASANLRVGILGASGEQTQSFSGVAPANSFLGGPGDFITVSGSADTSLAANLDYYTGTGGVGFSGDGACNLISSDPSSLNYLPMSHNGYLWSADGRIIYTYNPVPEPSALTLLLGGLALLGLRSRRESRSFSPTA